MLQNCTSMQDKASGMRGGPGSLNAEWERKWVLRVLEHVALDQLVSSQMRSGKWEVGLWRVSTCACLVLPYHGHLFVSFWGLGNMRTQCKMLARCALGSGRSSIHSVLSPYLMSLSWNFPFHLYVVPYVFEINNMIMETNCIRLPVACQCLCWVSVVCLCGMSSCWYCVDHWFNFFFQSFPSNTVQYRWWLYCDGYWAVVICCPPSVWVIDLAYSGMGMVTIVLCHIRIWHVT